MGCNLGKAVTISPIVFLGSGSVLRDCHVASLLAMTRQGSAVVHQRSPAVELLPTGRSLSAATVKFGSDRVRRHSVYIGSAFPRLPRRPLASSQWQGRRLSAFFLIHFSVFRIHSFPCPAPTANSPARRKKSSDLSIGASCWRYLSSRAVTRKVLSAQMSLTSVFGMGTGVPSPQSTPTIWGHTLKTEQE